jgi:hypothetical protein
VGPQPSFRHLTSTVDIPVAGHANIDSTPFWVATLGYETYGDTDAIERRRGSLRPCRRVGDLSMIRTPPIGGRVASPDNNGIDIAAWNDTWG